MKSTTVPIIRYQDAKKSIAWLCDTLGFEVFLSVPGEADRIEHSRLVLGDSMVMIASIGRQGNFEAKFKLPSSVKGITQCTSLTVENPDEIYLKVKQSGVNIIDEIDDLEFGGRSFSCEDTESQVWVISSHDPWEKIW